MKINEYLIKVNGKEFRGKVDPNTNKLVIDEKFYEIENLKSLAPGAYAVKVNGKIYNFEVKPTGNETFQIFIDGYSFETEVLDQTILMLRSFAKSRDEGVSGQFKLRAPMPGLVVKVLTSEGENVNKGDKLVIIEAMKMENALSTPISGIVQKVFVQEGQTVEKDAILVEIVSQ